MSKNSLKPGAGQDLLVIARRRDKDPHAPDGGPVEAPSPGDDLSDRRKGLKAALLRKPSITAGKVDDILSASRRGLKDARKGPPKTAPPFEAPAIPQFIVNTRRANGFKTKAVRGMMLNPNIKNPLALAFHVNPTQIEIDKQNNWDIETPLGFQAPIVTWVSGGRKMIKFDLFFDGTKAAEQNGLTFFTVPFIGTRGVISVIESFLLPDKGLIERFAPNPDGGNKTPPPPDIILVLGARFWKVKLLTAPLKEILFDKFLTPMRLMTSLEMIVLEEGKIQVVDDATRTGFSLIESTVGFVSTNISVFTQRRGI